MSRSAFPAVLLFLALGCLATSASAQRPRGKKKATVHKVVSTSKSTGRTSQKPVVSLKLATKKDGPSLTKSKAVHAQLKEVHQQLNTIYIKLSEKLSLHKELVDKTKKIEGTAYARPNTLRRLRDAMTFEIALMQGLLRDMRRDTEGSKSSVDLSGKIVKHHSGLKSDLIAKSHTTLEMNLVQLKPLTQTFQKREKQFTSQFATINSLAKEFRDHATWEPGPTKAAAPRYRKKNHSKITTWRNGKPTRLETWR